MTDINKLRRLAQAVNGQANCNQVWIDQDEDVRTVMVGYIGEGGDVYHVVTIEPHYTEGQSLPLGKFYAAANPAAVLELLDRIETAEKSDAESIAMYRKARDERDILRIENEALRAEVTHIKEVEFPRKAQAVADGWRGKVEAAEKDRDEFKRACFGHISDNSLLRAKIEAMENQEPIGEIVAFGEFLHEPSWKRGKLPQLGTKLYALPGVKGEEK